MKRHACILFIAGLLPLFTSAEYCPNNPFESGTRLALTVNLTVTTENYYWYTVIDGYLRYVALCSADTLTCFNYPDGVNTSIVKKTPTTGKPYYQSTIDIRQVNTTMSGIVLKRGSEGHFNCVMQVYVKPEKPTCDDPEFINSNEQLQVNCRTKKVYPKALCVFSSQGPSIGAGQSSYNSRSTSDSRYYKTECQFTAPTESLSPGRYAFMVTVYPDVIGGIQFQASSDLTEAITYDPATVTKFSVNATSTSSVTTNPGSDAVFLCEATGDPDPRIILYQDSTKKVLDENPEGQSLTYMKTDLQCVDTSIYTCYARNGQTGWKSVEIYVRCPLQLKKASYNNTVYRRDEGSDATIEVEVIGYPRPVNYSFNFKDNSANHTIDKERYKIDYTSSLHTIKLTILNATSEYATKYILTLTNGQSELRFHFSISFEKEEDPVWPIIVGVVVGVVGIVVLGAAAYFLFGCVSNAVGAA